MTVLPPRRAADPHATGRPGTRPVTPLLVLAAVLVGLALAFAQPERMHSEVTGPTLVTGETRHAEPTTGSGATHPPR